MRCILAPARAPAAWATCTTGFLNVGKAKCTFVKLSRRRRATAGAGAPTCASTYLLSARLFLPPHLQKYTHTHTHTHTQSRPLSFACSSPAQLRSSTSLWYLPKLIRKCFALSDQVSPNNVANRLTFFCTRYFHKAAHQAAPPTDQPMSHSFRRCPVSKELPSAQRQSLSVPQHWNPRQHGSFIKRVVLTRTNQLSRTVIECPLPFTVEHPAILWEPRIHLACTPPPFYRSPQHARPASPRSGPPGTLRAANGGKCLFLVDSRAFLPPLQRDGLVVVNSGLQWRLR